MKEEIWVRSPSLPFLSVSSLGRLLIDSYEIDMPRGGKKAINPKPTFGVKKKVSKNYERYIFVNRKRGLQIKVHQLVAEAFHGLKPFDSAVVLHLDNNPLNNECSNLKWGTQKENLNTPEFIAYCKSRTGDDSPVRKAMLRTRK